MSDTLLALWLVLTACLFGPNCEKFPIELQPEIPAETDEVKPPDPTPRSNAMPIVCDVKIEKAANRRTIVALASASGAPQSGRFAIEIEKTGANTARTRQRGDFALAPGETKELAVVRMNLGSGEAIGGRLSLDWQGGHTSCPIK